MRCDSGSDIAVVKQVIMIRLVFLPTKVWLDVQNIPGAQGAMYALGPVYVSVQ